MADWYAFQNNLYFDNMLHLRNKTDRKYFIIEVCFFVFIAYISSVISDLEYSYYEQHNILKFTSALEYRLVIGTFNFAFYGCYYWFFLKRYVYHKRIGAIILSSIAFMLISHIYDKFVMYGSVSKMPFVSKELRAQALKEFSRPHIYFTFNYLVSMVVIPVTGFSFLIRSLQQDEQLKTLKEQQLLSELTYLKAQLHPHFFFNTINNIYALALKQSADTAPMVAKLAEMMRYILYEADQKVVLLDREIEFLNNYIGTEKIRHRHNDIRFDVQGIDRNISIEPLLLLPFVENAFKHGLEQETGNGYVHIVICLVENELTIEVTNSKPPGGKMQATKGIGMQNLQKRLAILYGGKHRVAVDDQADKYQITLTLQTV
jgi:hypothetical protein